jgi:hypothetical protein
MSIQTVATKVKNDFLDNLRTLAMFFSLNDVNSPFYIQQLYFSSIVNRNIEFHYDTDIIIIITCETPYVLELTINSELFGELKVNIGFDHIEDLMRLLLDRKPENITFLIDQMLTCITLSQCIYCWNSIIDNFDTKAQIYRNTYSYYYENDEKYVLPNDNKMTISEFIREIDEQNPTTDVYTIEEKKGTLTMIESILRLFFSDPNLFRPKDKSYYFRWNIPEKPSALACQLNILLMAVDTNVLRKLIEYAGLDLMKYLIELEKILAIEDLSVDTNMSSSDRIPVVDKNCIAYLLQPFEFYSNAFREACKRLKIKPNPPINYRLSGDKTFSSILKGNLVNHSLIHTFDKKSENGKYLCFGDGSAFYPDPLWKINLQDGTEMTIHTTKKLHPEPDLSRYSENISVFIPLILEDTIDPDTIIEYYNGAYLRLSIVDRFCRAHNKDWDKIGDMMHFRNLYAHTKSIVGKYQLKASVCLLLINTLIVKPMQYTIMMTFIMCMNSKYFNHESYYQIIPRELLMIIYDFLIEREE